jgi:hypothetical protein
MDKTIKVWRIDEGGLVLESNLNLIRDLDTKWAFPKQIIRNQIENIQESIKFMENQENITIQPQERIAITSRLLIKIFSRED